MNNRGSAKFAGGMCLVLGTWLSGCADPESVVAFDASEPAARFRAARKACTDADRSSVPHLINMLSSDDPAERFIAIQALADLTGESKGYLHAAPLRERQEAIARWKAWYADQDATLAPVSPNTGRAPAALAPLA